MRLNASRLVEVTYKGRLEEISLLAGEVAGKGIDVERNILDLDQVATEVSSFLEGSTARLQLRENMLFIGRIILQKLCQLHNCCYSP